MVDYAVDGNFDINTNKYGDIGEVDELPEFEQRLLIRIHFSLEEYIGGLRQTDTLRERVNLLATRVAREMDVIDYLASISIREAENAGDTLKLELHYTTGRTFNETI